MDSMRLKTLQGLATNDIESRFLDPMEMFRRLETPPDSGEFLDAFESLRAAELRVGEVYSVNTGCSEGLNQPCARLMLCLVENPPSPMQTTECRGVFYQFITTAWCVSAKAR